MPGNQAKRLFQNTPLNKLIKIFLVPSFLQKRRLFRSFFEKSCTKNFCYFKENF
jgi:hypothetical protein